jgi:hypothetical protein
MRCDFENSLSVYQDFVGFMMDARPTRGIQLIYVASHKVWPALQSAEGHSTDDRTSRWLVGGLEFGRHTVAPQKSGTTPIDRPQPRFPLSYVASPDSLTRYLFVGSTACFLGGQV